MQRLSLGLSWQSDDDDVHDLETRNLKVWHRIQLLVEVQAKIF
jgi:hypothetical protein